MLYLARLGLTRLVKACLGFLNLVRTGYAKMLEKARQARLVYVRLV